MNNRLRVGFALTIIAGTIYGFTGLFNSLLDFGIGAAIAAIGVIGYGLIDFIEDANHQLDTLITDGLEDIDRSHDMGQQWWIDR